MDKKDPTQPLLSNGYIRLHRSISKWQFGKNPLLCYVWMYLLMYANYEDRVQEGVTIRRGELLISQPWFAEHIGITLAQLRNCLALLEGTHEIARQRVRCLTHIKILKYSDFQGVVDAESAPCSVPNAMPSSVPNSVIERNINNNKKNLSDGEMKKSTPLRLVYAKQLAAHDGWKQKCCRDRHIAPEQIDRHIIAFHEHLLRNNPGKSWLSFDDFCLHFHSWIRFQKPEDIANLLAQAMHRSRQQKAKAIEQQRQQQMWQDIEAAKQNAVSYEEYKRGKEGIM